MPFPSVQSYRDWRYWDASVPVWYDSEYRLPLTAFGKHTGLEPRRADLVAWYLLEWKWARRGNFRTPARARYEDLGRAHSEEYLERLSTPETLAQIFGVDAWDVPVDEVMRTVRLGVGGTIAAARDALARRGATVNLAGGFHHAGPNWGSGLCALNDMAVAVAVLRHEGFTGRVVILDLDAHPPDGTAACLACDPGVWIGSLSGAASTIVSGVDETVLPQNCDDETYRAALDGLLGRMPDPDLAMVIAGGDVLAGDHLGCLGLTMNGARARDLRVARVLHGVPTVWLPGGGYHALAWQVLAGTVIALLRHTRRPIRPGADPMAVRFARLSRHLAAQAPRASHELRMADIEADLGVAAGGPAVLLGAFTAEAIEYALFRFGVLGFLERRGYGQFRVALSTATSGGERVCVFGQSDGPEHLLVECVLQRRIIAEAEVLYIHWLALRDPRARFSDRRPRLPGQESPGLGLAREMAELLAVLAERLHLAGVAYTPAHYHTAYVARDRFRFVNPHRQGRFEAMVRDFDGLNLAEVSMAMASGRVRLNGDPYRWEPDDFVSWTGRRVSDEPAIAEARARAHFSLAPPAEAGERRAAPLER